MNKLLLNGPALLLTGCLVGVGTVDEVPPGMTPQPEPPVSGGVAVHSILSGRFAPLPGYGTAKIGGNATLVRSAEQPGKTTVQIHVNGLQPTTSYMAHVHALPCAFGGGGHYKIDPSIAVAMETNEIWMMLMTDAKGVGNASISAPGKARGDALSVVVHNPADSTKMICADLVNVPGQPASAAGDVAPFAAAEAIDQTITGTAELTRGMTSTVVSLALKGLTPGAMYMAHVHTLPCAVQAAGGHYMIDPTALTPIATNELWPEVVPAADGTSTGSYSVALHVARADAQSVVVHRIGATPLKVACTDLVPAKQFDLVAQGTGIALQPAIDKGMSKLLITGTLVRELGGYTRVILSGTGLGASTKYAAHVHALPCAIDGGGGHYMIDPTAAAGHDNEIWLDLESTADGTGASTMTVAHLARPDAQSIVIHDPVDKARLSCIDLATTR
jgi:hypothetical protein